MGILALAGFSGCSPKVEYGCPHANLTVKAEALDEGDGRWDHGEYEINVNLKLKEKGL